MVDIRFSRNEYTWANQGIVPAMADAVELTKTIQERALEALRAHRATLGEDTAVRIYVGSTEPVGAAHGDFWWNGDNRQRKDSWAGETSRTNLFTDQRPLEAMPNHYVTSGSMSLYLGNEIRYVMTAGGEFRAGFNITGTGTHTFAFEFRSTTVSALRSFHLRTSDGAIDRYVVLSAYEEWLRVEDTVTGPVQVYLTPEVAENPDAGDVVFIKDIIVEAGADAGVFFDGAMPMCSWTGTPGLSTSTYTPGWSNAPALSDLIAVLTQTSYQDGFVDIYLGPEIPLFPGEGDLWDDGAEFKVFDGMGWQILIDATGTVIDDIIRENVRPIVGEIIDPIILPIYDDIDRIDGELVVVGTEVTAVSEWVNVTGAQLDANLAQAQIDLDAAEAALNAAIADLDTLENTTLPALDLEITNAQGELDTLANTTIPALDTRLDAAEADLTTLSSTTLPALNTQITDAQSALNAAFPSGVFDVEGALDTTITGTVIEYAVNSSETVAPTTGWSTAQPTRTPGTFVWFRTKVTYGSGTANTSSAALLTGNTGATGPEGPAGSQGIQGPPGADGVSTYTWLKYADTPTTGMSDTPAGKTYMGLAHNKPTATESSDYSDYQWSLIKGEDGIDGEPGIPGPPGADGQTTYTWVKYADNASGGGMADLPAGKTYIGLAFNKTTATESTTATDYQWSLIQGPQGPQGSQGIQGPPGADGQTTYTWLKYADTPTTGMSDTPTGKTYMGLAYNKTTATESENYSDYAWSLIRGADGSDGKGISNTVVTYQTHSNGTTAPTGTWSATPTATTVGQFLWTKTETTYTDATKSTAYSVAAHGATGPGGSTGAAGRGITGTTVEYQASGSGTIAPTGTWTTAIPATTPGQWLWTRTTTTFSSAPSPVLSYAVAKHGETGQQGVQGPPGADGQPTYTWIKYAPNGAPTAVQMSDSPTNMTHIGLAFNKTTATESTVPTDYQWALIQGAPGADGISITSVTPYFLQQVSATAPAKPTASPPPAPWTATEPTWVSGQNLYRTERIIYSDASFVYTDVSKVAAYAAANAAMLAANSKNTNTYTDLVRPALPGGNPTVTGRRVGDVHRWRYTDNGEVIKEIILNASNAWQDIKFGDSVLTTLDVGKLTAGTATIQTAVIEALAVEIATVIELAAERITSGTVAAGRIDTTSLAAAIATIIQLDADRITSGTIDTARLNATEIAAQIATIIQLNASSIVAGEIGAARIDTTELATALANIITANIENLRVGTGTMDTAVISKLWTDVVRSRKITTDMMVVGSGDNLIPDPHLIDSTLSAARSAASDGTWVVSGEAGENIISGTGGLTLDLVGSSSTIPAGQMYPVTPGKRYRIRHDHRYNGSAEFSPTVRVHVLWINSTGTVTTDSLGQAVVGLAWGTDEEDWTAPPTAVGAYVRLGWTALAGLTLSHRRISMTSLTDPSLIVEGSINAAVEVGAGGRLFVQAPDGTMTQMVSTGIEHWAPGSTTDDPPMLVSRFGRDLQFIVPGSDGGIFGFNELGDASASGLSTLDDPRIAGTPLLGTLAIKNEDVSLDTDLGHIDRVSFSGNTARMDFDPSTWTYNTAGEKPVMEVLREQQAGRAVTVWVAGKIRFRTPNVANAFRIYLRKTELDLPTTVLPPRPEITTPLALADSDQFYNAYGQAPFVLNMGVHTPARSELARWLVCVASAGGTTTDWRVDQMRIIFQDLGPISDVVLPSVVRVVPDGAAPPPTETPKKTYTSRWYANSIRRAQGSVLTASGSRPGRAIQGWHSGFSGGPYHSIMGFTGNAHFGERDRTISSVLSGATISRARLRVTMANGYPGLGATVGIQSSSTAIPTILQTTEGMTNGQSVYAILATGFRTGLAAGQRYITLGPGPQSAFTYAEFHGTSGGDSARVELEITYER